MIPRCASLSSTLRKCFGDCPLAEATLHPPAALILTHHGPCPPPLLPLLLQASSTASAITCTSPKCGCGSPRCGCTAGQCTYSRSYAEQSSSSGVLLEDVLALHDGEPAVGGRHVRWSVITRRLMPSIGPGLLLALRGLAPCLAAAHCAALPAVYSLSAAAGLPGSPIIFGCETRETGEIFKQRADGLFGLGNSEASGAPATVCRLPLPARPLTLLQPGTVRFHSFLLPPLMRPPASPDPTHPTLLLPLPAAPAVVNQLVKAGVIDDVFSICFGMVEGDGALLLGAAEVPGEFMLQYTPLLTSATHPFYYNVKMLSLAVDGQLLAVSQVRVCCGESECECECCWGNSLQRARY